ncbi:hypothetical protein, partial [Companilactobacillus mindensis]|uniref:hypothetical protein n=1 Tax=Companilactobacillus mindensis TaxID=167481 RepID=UPI000709D984
TAFQQSTRISWKTAVNQFQIILIYIFNKTADINIPRPKILKLSSLEWNSGGCSAVVVSWLAYLASLETDKLKDNSQNWL